MNRYSRGSQPGRGNVYQWEHGPGPFAVNVECAAKKNQNYRAAVWTGENLQMTVMSIPTQCETGVEVHPDTDQMLRVEDGQGLVRVGCSEDQLNCKQKLDIGDAVFIPAGVWYNFMNTGECNLKLSSVYAPPEHARGTVHRTKEEAEASEQKLGASQSETRSKQNNDVKDEVT